jgi:hypothetical protein
MEITGNIIRFWWDLNETGDWPVCFYMVVEDLETGERSVVTCPNPDPREVIHE